MKVGYEKHHDEKLTFKDYKALYKLSARGWIWRHEGDAFLQNLFRNRALIFWAICWFAIIDSHYFLLQSMIGIIYSVFHPSTLLKTLVGFSELLAVNLLIIDPVKLKRSLHFTKSAWWKNTGIHPVEIIQDAGLYGEYIATMRVEEELDKAHVYGKIYNSLMIPIQNHGQNAWSEADIVAVTENGIQVFEVKNHMGLIEGAFNGDVWYRNGDYTADPPYKNPLLQNQQHVNYLIEYLYPRMAAAGMLDSSRSLLHHFVNIVMYTQNRYLNIGLDFSQMPMQTGFCMTGGRTPVDYTVKLTKNLCSGNFTHEQVDYICSVLDPLAAVDPYQHAAMVAAKVRQESMFDNDPQYRASYRVVVGNINGGEPLVNIAKTVSPYTWYDIEGNYFFWAEPEFCILEQSAPAGGRAGYQQSLALARQMTGQAA
ncbi:MAG: NERD domain-containing protein [Clostridiales bacterium]|nr:NERD domain-containing protein [Clostridiales bacterium]